MPIIERTPQLCFDVFEQHVKSLVAATLTKQPLIGLPGEKGRMTLSFREGEAPIAAPINTSLGRLYLQLSHALEAVPEHGAYRLKTRRYWYRIQRSPDFRSKAILRWEYDSQTAADQHARHHAQLATTIALDDGEALELNKLHLPTGWVTIEEVIRFLIVDLRVAPPCGDAWPAKLAKSERRFFDEFTGKRAEFAERTGYGPGREG